MPYSILKLQVLIDPPAAGAWNMAVDEALLIDAAEHGRATLRFYQWNEPTLSLGYFQPYADRQSHPASLACPLVRRASGGGAIIHDAELTYSLSIPDLGAPAACLYELMHETLVAALAELDVAAFRWGGCQAGEPAQEVTVAQPFLCFLRRAPGDVMAGEFKIGGSAQRRRGHAVLQHGSVLLRSTAAAPELPGILERSARSITPSELTEAWMAQLSERGISLDVPTHLEGQLHTTARRFHREKYGADTWNRRR